MDPPMLVFRRMGERECIWPPQNPAKYGGHQSFAVQPALCQVKAIQLYLPMPAIQSVFIAKPLLAMVIQIGMSPHAMRWRFYLRIDERYAALLDSIPSHGRTIGHRQKQATSPPMSKKVVAQCGMTMARMQAG